MHGEKGLAGIEERACAPDGCNPGPAGRACVCASISHDRHITPRSWRRSGLQRMAVLLQRAVLFAPAAANRMGHRCRRIMTFLSRGARPDHFTIGNSI